jgi:hypothetical protein
LPNPGKYLRIKSQKKVVLAPTRNMIIILLSRSGANIECRIYAEIPPIIKLKAARKPANILLGAVLILIRSHRRHTRYDEDPAAIAGSSQISIEKIIHSPLILFYHDNRY